MQGYQISKEAQDDLREISRYSRKVWGNKQTKKYLSEIKGAFETLVISPELGKMRDEIIDGVRSFSIGRHAIFIVSVKLKSRLPVSYITEWM